MANSAYSVDFTQATRPAFEAARDIDQMQTNETIRQGHQQQMAINQYQIDKMQKQKKWDETYVSSSTYLPNLNKFPSVKKQMDGLIKSMGADARTVGNDVHMKNEDWKRGMETIKASAEIQKDINDNFIRDLTAQKVQLQDPEYVKEQQKANKDFDPKKAMETIDKQLDVHWQQDPKLKAELMKEQARAKLEQDRQKAADIRKDKEIKAKHEDVQATNTSRERVAAKKEALKSKEAKTGKWIYDGTNEDGKPMYHNDKTLEERVGSQKIKAKPKAAGDNWGRSRATPTTKRATG